MGSDCISSWSLLIFLLWVLPGQTVSKTCFLMPLLISYDVTHSFVCQRLGVLGRLWLCLIDCCFLEIFVFIFCNTKSSTFIFYVLFNLILFICRLPFQKDNDRKLTTWSLSWLFPNFRGHIIRIFNGCEVRIENSVTRVIVRHYETRRVMLNS